MSAREALAAAADTVEGITAHPYITHDLDPGTVFIRYERTEHPNRFGGVDHWNVILVLPQEPADAEVYLEATRGPLTTALNTELVVTNVRRQRLDITGVGIVPCAFFNGHREAD